MTLETQSDVEIRACRSCQAPVFDDELFCEMCGTRLIEEAADAVAEGRRSSDRQELDLGSVAAVTDRGLRRRRNEDAMAVATSERGAVAVVCDGVASTANPHLAARAAAEETLQSLDPVLRATDPLDADAVSAFMASAFESAQMAVSRVPDDEPDGNDLSPSTTMVAAVVTSERIVIGNLGDSRAYWLSPTGCRLLTTDDSLAQDRIAEGTAAAAAYAHPDAHTITRWIGADAESVEPSLFEMAVVQPGVLLLCTDGLWNYFRDAAALGDLVFQSATPAPGETARRLTDAALKAGGQDNVTVAVVSVHPRTALPNGATEETPNHG
jgi:serine/threonine protein phosphatase PrpC